MQESDLLELATLVVPLPLKDKKRHHCNINNSNIAERNIFHLLLPLFSFSNWFSAKCIKKSALNNGSWSLFICIVLVVLKSNCGIHNAFVLYRPGHTVWEASLGSKKVSWVETVTVVKFTQNLNEIHQNWNVLTSPFWENSIFVF